MLRAGPATLAGLVLVAALAGCGSEDDAPLPPGAQPRLAAGEGQGDDPVLRPVKVADLGEMGTALAAHPDEPLLLAARRSGAVHPIRLREDGEHLVPELDPAPALDLSGTVTTDGERGLLDLTFSPDGQDLYASYTDPEGAVTVARFAYADGTLAPDPELLAVVEHPFAGHNGGDLEWLDDETLLWSLGDMDLTETDPPAAQDPAVPYGRIVALDVTRTGPPLTADDLAATPPVATGLRNPWRIHHDATQDRLVVGDVGEDGFEELDVVDLGAPTAPNFGWPDVEGTTRMAPVSGGTSYEEPVLVRPHGDEVCAIVAGVTVPEDLSPALAGRFLFGDNCSGEVHAVTIGEPRSDVVAEVDDGVVSFGAGATGEVYVLGFSGGIWRLDPPEWDVDAPSTPPLPPSDQDAAGGPELPPAELQAVCDVRAAFALLEQVPGAPVAEFERLATTAATDFEAAAPDLPDAVDTGALRRVVDDAVALGRDTGWDTSTPAFARLLAATTAGDPPYQDFPAAMATLVDLGATC